MRNKLIKLLRKLDNESYFKNEYKDTLGYALYNYEITEHIIYPNYRLVEKRYNDAYPLPKHKGQQPVTLSGYINSELKRMEMDGLIMIGIQIVTKSAYAINGVGPDYDDESSNTESIILTTKGKSGFRYFMYKVTENPVTIVLSVLAIIISVISLVS